MGDLPILFSAPMVRALLREIEQPGTGKTQTRRGLILRRYRGFTEFGRSDTPGYDWHLRDREKRWHDLRHSALLKLLPYQPGHRLYVREHWRTYAQWDDMAPRDLVRGTPVSFEADYGQEPNDGCRGRFRQGMHMPKWASRITLIVTDVRAERLQECSEADAIAEGCPARSSEDLAGMEARGWYADLWDSLNDGPKRPGRAWRDNPWIVAYTFRPFLGNIDHIARAA